MKRFLAIVLTLVLSFSFAACGTADEETLCRDCGKEISSESQFCSYCGTAVDVVCPSCNKAISADSKFCSHCGAAVGEEEAASNEDAQIGKDEVETTPEVIQTPAPEATPESTPVATPEPMPVATPEPTTEATPSAEPTPPPTPTPAPTPTPEDRQVAAFNTLKEWIINHCQSSLSDSNSKVYQEIFPHEGWREQIQIIYTVDINKITLEHMLIHDEQRYSEVSSLILLPKGNTFDCALTYDCLSPNYSRYTFEGKGCISAKEFRTEYDFAFKSYTEAGGKVLAIPIEEHFIFADDAKVAYIELIFFVENIFKSLSSVTNLYSMEDFGFFRALSQSFTYEEIARYPDKYRNERVKVTGRVIQVVEEANSNSTQYALRVNITNQGRDNYTDTIYVNYVARTGEARIFEDDIIVLYGYVDGTTTYTSVSGQAITLPNFDAHYIDLYNYPSVVGCYYGENGYIMFYADGTLETSPNNFSSCLTGTWTQTKDDVYFTLFDDTGFVWNPVSTTVYHDGIDFWGDYYEKSDDY